jgi:hypothetical protein
LTGPISSGCFKTLAAQADTIEMVHRLTPIGVAMGAGRHV